ncbi:MAG TPA: YIP1 family protein [Telluria sp.]|nr:YIP1 family protein [Telluria sp.]
MIEIAPPASTGPFSALVGMFYEPARVFAQLEARRSTWLPALLVILTSSVMAYWFFQFVDFAWLQERMLAVIEDPAVREKQREMGMSRQTMAAFASGGSAVALLVGFALTGLYFAIVGKVRNNDVGFAKGFSLGAWSAVPYLLLFPLGAMQMTLASNNQISFESLNPLTLNQLVFHYENTHPLAGFLEAISVPMVWAICLLVIGYQVWAKASRATALKVVLLPYVVIYGAWLAYALSKTA